MPNVIRRPATAERALRPVARLESTAEQRARFEELIDQGSWAASLAQPASMGRAPGPPSLPTMTRWMRERSRVPEG